MEKLTSEEKRVRHLRSCRKNRAKEKKFGEIYAEKFRKIVDVLMIICKKEGREEEWEELMKAERRKEPKYEQKEMILEMVCEKLWKLEGIVSLSAASTERLSSCDEIVAREVVCRGVGVLSLDDPNLCYGHQDGGGHDCLCSLCRM